MFELKPVNKSERMSKKIKAEVKAKKIEVSTK